MYEIIISKDLLENLIDIAEEWVGQNEWRRNTTVRNHRMLLDNEETILKVKKLLAECNVNKVVEIKY